MNVLVIPDIHLKTWLFDKAEAILKEGKADMVVCLMDIPDDWDMELRIRIVTEPRESITWHLKKMLLIVSAAVIATADVRSRWIR